MHKTIRYTFLLATLTASSFASVVSVINPVDLNASDSVDWAQLGPDFTTVSSPVGAISAGGNVVSAQNGTNDFYVVQQGNTWNGNFNPTDTVLYNQAAGNVTIMFLNPVAGVGARFQSVDFGAFTIFITAFDSGNSFLGSVSTTGTSNANADGSAAFLGVLSSNADIASVVVNVTLGAVDNAFALGSLSIAEQPVPGVPEPSTMFLAIGGMLACVARRLKTRSR